VARLSDFVEQGKADGSIATAASPEETALYVTTFMDGLGPPRRYGLMEPSEIDALVRRLLTDVGISLGP
jgi:hypothetical protein